MRARDFEIGSRAAAVLSVAKDNLNEHFGEIRKAYLGLFFKETVGKRKAIAQKLKAHQVMGGVGFFFFFSFLSFFFFFFSRSSSRRFRIRFSLSDSGTKELSSVCLLFYVC